MINTVGGPVAGVVVTPTGLCFLPARGLAFRLGAGSLALAYSRVRQKPLPADPAGFLPGFGHGCQSSSGFVWGQLGRTREQRVMQPISLTNALARAMPGITAGLLLMDPRKVVDLFLGEWMPNQVRHIPVAWVIFDEQGWVTLHERRRAQAPLPKYSSYN